MTRASLESMIRIHQSGLFRYLRYLGAHMHTAEDILQETFLAAFEAKKQPEDDDIAGQGAWLRAIARNQFLMNCRKTRRESVYFNSDMIEEAERTWQDRYLRDSDGYDYVQALRACVDKLSQRSRRAITLFYEQRKSRKELAELFQRSEDGIKSMLRTIRQLLGDCIESTLKTGAGQ